MISTETEEIGDIRAVAADFFARHRTSLDDDDAPRYDRATWRRACTDLGVASIVEPELDGGLEGGAAMLAAVLVEAGRHLSPLPLLGSAVLAQTALRLLAAPDARASRLEALMAGDVVATLAPWEQSLVSVVATATDGGWRLDGSVGTVLDGVDADVLLVLADVDGRVGLFEVAAPDVADRTGQTTLDLTRRFARLTFDATPATLLGTGGPEVLDTVAAWRTLALVSDQLGGAEECLGSTVEYLKNRVQFGRVIGSFQALKHQCADLAILVDDVRSALAHLAWALDESPGHVDAAAAVAVVTGSEAYVTCAEEMVHLHGGIGFTWEHDAHRYVRRALADRGVFHDVRAARERVLASHGL